MSSRLDYYYRQRVTEAELDLGFEQLEQADRDLARDIGVFGIINEMVASEKLAVPDLTLDITAPGLAYDQLGQRIYFGAAQSVDLSTDLNGVSTDVQNPGNEKIVSLFVKFSRSLSDPRTDGNSQTVYFLRDESFEFVVRQGAEAAPGSTVPPPLQPDEILIVDAKRTHGQTQIFNTDLSPNPLVPGDIGRKQRFVFVEAESIGVVTGAFDTLQPARDDVQAVLDEVDSKLTEHFAGSTGKHSASDIDASGQSGSPNSLAAGTVRTQLNQLLGHLNDHENTSNNAHPATAVDYSAGPDWHDGTTNPATTIKNQADKIVTDLVANEGSDRIGSGSYSYGGESLSVGSIWDQLRSLLQKVSQRARLNVSQYWSGTQNFAGLTANTAQMNGPLILDPDDEDDPALALLKDLTGKQLIFYKEYGSAVRIYVDENALWLTVNAEWSNGASRWEKGTIGVGSLALFMSADNFRILWESGNSSDWTEFDWDRGVELGGLTYTTNFVEWRDFSEWGLYTRVPIYVRTYTANSAENVGGAFSYPIRFSSAPSSVTIVTSFKNPTSWAVEPTVLSSMNSERGGAWYGRPYTFGTGYVELGAEVYAQ